MFDKREYMRKWRAANRDKQLAYFKARYKANAEEMKAKARPRAAKWFAANRERANENSARWYAQNKERHIQYGQARRKADPSIRKREYAANIDRHKERSKRWAEQNPERAKRTLAAWKKANRGAVYAAIAKRKADKIQRTPVWADLEAIKAFYAACPAGYHVDHIVPLKGKTVCGFHAENNLQYLPAVDNLRKANKLIEA